MDDTTPAASASSNAPTAESIAQANTALSFDLLKKLSEKTPNKNVFISPLSIGMALGLTFNGARGSTRAAMSRVLHLPAASQEALNKAYGNLMNSFANPNASVHVEIANALYTNRNVDFESAFVKDARTSFQSEVASVDFSSPNTVQQINGWVNQKTHGKIPNIIDKLNGSEASIILNAAYFKGNWQSQFEKAGTTDDDFHMADGSKKKLPFMHQRHFYEYLKTPDFQAVVLPYIDSKYSACIFLPGSNSSLIQLQKALSLSNWNNWSKEFESKQGDLALPRFKLNYNTSLSDSMKALGMNVAFDKDQADFSGMHKGKPALFIGDIKHKTYLKVDEQGTEAAAATAVQMMGAGMMIPKETFKMVVDHPFLFAIRDNDSNSLLFVGLVYDPQ
jgi:serpin B